MILSIIIPAYNAESTIIRCLNSVYALLVSEYEFEVIVIDDCSTDHTVDIIKVYEQDHSNLTLLIQPQNHRQGSARNRGLSIANGDFIVYLDSDDEIESGVLSALSLSQRNNLDMVVMRYKEVSSEGVLEKESILPYTPDTVFTGVEFQTAFPFFCTAPWAYLFRRSFLKRVNYPFVEDVLFEDSDYVNVHLYNSVRMAYCNECGYCFRRNPLSTTHTFSYKHVCDYALLGTRMLSFYHQIEDKSTLYAHSILEGGSYNIMRSCKNLFKLHSFADVRFFYDRFDYYSDRSALLLYKEPAYCWNRWTRFCLKNKNCSIFIVGSIIALSRFPLIKKMIR